VSLDYEIALLSAVLQRNEAYYDVCDIITEKDFLEPFHADLWAAIGRDLMQGRQTTAFNLRQWAGEREDYLYAMATNRITTRPLEVRNFARLVKLNRTRKAIVSTAGKLEKLSENFDGIDGTAETLAADAIHMISAALDTGGASEAATSTAAYADEYWEWLASEDKNSGLKLGFPALDEKLCGLEGGNLTIVGGRSSMGKTAFALSAAVNVARQGSPVLFFSLEMSRKELMQRLVTMHDGPSLRRQREVLMPQEAAAVGDIIQQIRSLPIYIVDKFASNVTEMAALVRKYVRKHGIKLVVIDYLQLLNPPKAENRTTEIEMITRALKTLAASVNIPIMVLSQLSRESDKRDDHKPRMSDLRSGGSIEQDADQVLLCFREWQYVKLNKMEPSPTESPMAFDIRLREWQALENTGEIIIAKNRHGETGMVTMGFQGSKFLWQEKTPDCR
jgi:replicative DNA helicase